MKSTFVLALALMIAFMLPVDSTVSAYTADTTVPTSGGCAQPDRWNATGGTQINRRWSTALPGSNIILTAATSSESAELAEIEQTISDSFGAWTGVTGTTLNAANYPNAFGPLDETVTADACSNDSESSPVMICTL